MREDDNRTLEQVYHSAVKGLYARLRSDYDFLYEKFGDEGLKLISDMSRQYGLTIAGRAKDRLKDNHISSVADYLLRIFDTVGRGKGTINVDEAGDRRVVIRIDECPLAFDKPQMCVAHTTMEKTVVEELNPALTYRIGKSIPAGDSYCEHIVEFKSAVGK